MNRRKENDMTKPDKITNREARDYVKNHKSFKASNIFATHVLGRAPDGSQIRTYVVYSYGTHFPIYAFSYEVNRWFANKDRYSITTSKHKGLCHPHESCVEVDTATLKQIIDNGVEATVMEKAARRV
jgi:hypothetical protein